MSAAERKALARRMYEEMCNERKLEIAGELCSSKLVFHEPVSVRDTVGKGPQEWAEEIRIYHTGFSNAHWKIHDVLEAEGNNIVVTWTGTGTNDGKLPGGIGPTGKKVKIEAISILTFDGKKIVSIRDMWDYHTFLEQLGLVPVTAQEKSSVE